MIIGVKCTIEGFFLIPAVGPIDIDSPMVGGPSSWLAAEDEYDIPALGVVAGILFMGTREMDLFTAVRELAAFSHPWQEDFLFLERLSCPGQEELLILQEGY